MSCVNKASAGWLSELWTCTTREHQWTYKRMKYLSAFFSPGVWNYPYGHIKTNEGLCKFIVFLLWRNNMQRITEEFKFIGWFFGGLYHKGVWWGHSVMWNISNEKKNMLRICGMLGLLGGGQKQRHKTIYEQRIICSHLVWNAVWSQPWKRDHVNVKGLFSEVCVPSAELFCALMKNTLHEQWESWS